MYGTPMCEVVYVIISTNKDASTKTIHFLYRKCPSNYSTRKKSTYGYVINFIDEIIKTETLIAILVCWCIIIIECKIGMFSEKVVTTINVIE